ncbi:hypothetical protein DEU38_107104 [Rhodococcus sp. AG1013]|uniref:LamG domain-containing protein n=1 Tax=Rhodococcus sp. AG1013 TaxID=2183996 RepID=UPI000E2CF385|nr:LamG domain-containing protein [Rhodococcus sp. AG1013]RDI28132.1 hypothetical protein DEU38_107104 [Rhodococcus sp. AG1013]
MNPAIAGRPTLVQGDKLRLFEGVTRLNENVAINIKNRSFSLTAQVQVPETGADGVIVTQGGRTGGWCLFTEGGKLGYHYNYCGLQRTTALSDDSLTPGQHQVRVEFTYDGDGIGKGGTATLYIDGDESGSARVPRTHPLYFSFDEGLDVGVDTGMPVYEGYKSPRGKFTGRIDWADIELGDDDHSHLIDPDDALAAVLKHQ